MKVELREVPTSTPEAFCEQHGLVMEVVERSREMREYTRLRYYASLKGVEVKDGGILSSPTGNGPTPELAIEDYWDHISERRLVVDAYRETRREIVAPRLVRAVPVACNVREKT